MGALAALFMVSKARAVPVSYEFIGESTEILDTNSYTTGLVSTSRPFRYRRPSGCSGLPSDYSAGCDVKQRNHFQSIHIRNLLHGGFLSGY